MTDGANDHLDKDYCILPHTFNHDEAAIKQRYTGTCVDGDSSFENYDILRQCMVRYFDNFDPIFTQSEQLLTEQKNFVTNYGNKFDMPPVDGMSAWKEELQERVFVKNSYAKYRGKMGLECNAVNQYL